MYTGLRLGEICGLKREDIDLEEKTITVKRNIVRLRIHEGARKTKLVAATPKTEQSRRTIPYPDVLHKTLEKVCRGKEGEDYLFGQTGKSLSESEDTDGKILQVLEEGGLRSVSSIP